MQRRMIIFSFALFGFAFSPIARAVTIIDNTTQGFYNAGLGDLATDSVLGAQFDAATSLDLFPAANGAGGDPLIPSVATQPNLAGADPAT